MSSLDEADAGKALIGALPRTAVQALYHAVTGKTENFSKWLQGNVIIRFSDISNLFSMLTEQIQHYDLLAPETVTIVVTDADDRKVTYSSWHRFEVLQAQSAKVTSDVSIKIEFVAQMPNTNTPQRCIVNVTLDSSLPVVDGHRRDSASPSIGFLMWMANDWRTVNVSIDFVDYLMARNFCSSVEEWFKALEKTPASPWNGMLLRSSRTITAISAQVGRMGCATFVCCYAFSTEKIPDNKTILAVAAISLFIWSCVSFLMSQVNQNVRRRAANCLMPTVILLNQQDDRVYASILEQSKTVIGTMARLTGGIVFAISLNVLASYLFEFLHG